jgi:hypothetical protein
MKVIKAAARTADFVVRAIFFASIAITPVAV